jgi:hypothetical protein
VELNVTNLKKRISSMRQILLLASIAIAACVLSPAAFAQSSGTVVDKDGSCPTGFKSSGSSCKSSSGDVAIIKLGACPTGFKASANYCIGDKAAYAEVKKGSCPTGLKGSGKYCVK